MRTTILMLSCAVVTACSNHGNECFDKARMDLKDPVGATLVSTEEVFDLVKIEMRAQNSFGAFGSVFATCRKDGSVEVTSDRSEWIRTIH